MQVALPAASALAQLSEETIRTVAESDQVLSAVFIAVGMLLGIYGSYGGPRDFRWVTVAGIALVLLGVLIQFGTVSGDQGSAIEVVLPAAIWIVVGVVGLILTTATSAKDPLGILAKSVGIVLLAACFATVVLAVAGVDGPLPGPFESIDVDSSFR